MFKNKILIIDSGIGGIHILKECYNAIPNYNFVYIADNENAPYGNKTKKQLQKIIFSIVKKAEASIKPKIVVFACNTLTVNAISYIRKKFQNIIFVGTEPAIKQAKIYGGDTILFATQSTIKNYNKLNKKIVKQLKKAYKKQNLIYKNTDKIYKLSIPNLPLEIDKQYNNLDNVLPVLRQYFNRVEYKNVKNIVIGCTHYIAIKKQIKAIFNENVVLFDNAFAVAKQVKSFCGKSKKISNIQDYKNRVQFLLTKENEKTKQLEEYFLSLF